MSVKHNQGIVVDGLKLLFDGKDPVSKSNKVTVGDLSGQGNTGTMYSGRGLHFESASLDVIVMEGSENVNAGLFEDWGDFTIALWVYPEAKPTPDSSALITKFADTQNYDLWWLRLNYASSTEVGQIEFSDYNSGGATKNIQYRADNLHVGTDKVPLNAWSHIIVTRNNYNVGGTADQFAIYVNGVEQPGIVADDLGTALLRNVDGPLYFGGSGTVPFASGTPKPVKMHQGSLSDIKIFNTGVSATQAVDLYNNPNKQLPGNISGSQLIFVPTTYTQEWIISHSSGEDYCSSPDGSNILQWDTTCCSMQGWEEDSSECLQYIYGSGGYLCRETELFGNPITHTITVEFTGTSGCTDVNACNYNLDANVNDESCTYPEVGDVNEDCIYDILDIVQTVQVALQEEPQTDQQLMLSDINNDGVINIMDIVLLVSLVLGRFLMRF